MMNFLVFLSDFIMPLMIFYIEGFGVLAGRPVYDDFIRVAKKGLKITADGGGQCAAGLRLSR